MKKKLLGIPSRYMDNSYNVYFMKSPLPMPDPWLCYTAVPVSLDNTSHQKESEKQDAIVAVAYNVSSDVLEFAMDFVQGKRWYQIDEFVKELQHIDSTIHSQLEEILTT